MKIKDSVVPVNGNVGLELGLDETIMEFPTTSSPAPAAVENGDSDGDASDTGGSWTVVNGNNNNNNNNRVRVVKGGDRVNQPQPQPQPLAPEYSKYAYIALDLMSKGDLNKALIYLDACLDPDKFKESSLSMTPLPQPHCPAPVVVSNGNSHHGSSTSESENHENHNFEGSGATGADLDILNLLEKRCLVLLKLRKYELVWENARRILEQSNHPVAFKCLIVSLCKLNKLDQVREVLKLWEKSSPTNLEMMSCRTKVDSLLKAVIHGIDGASAFEGLEETLGLSPDWLLGTRKAHDPKWKYRPVPPGPGTNNSFVLCLQFRFGHCSLGEKCTDAHGEKELEEWKSRSALADITSSLEHGKLDSGSAYLKQIGEEIQKASNSGTGGILVDNLPGVTITVTQPLQTQVSSSAPGSNYVWDFEISSPSTRPLHTIALLHDLHRSYFKIIAATFNGNKNTVDLRVGKSGAAPVDQVLESTVSPTALTLSGGLGPGNKFRYSIRIQFSQPQPVFGTFRQRIVLDFGSKEPKKIVRDFEIEVVPPTTAAPTPTPVPRPGSSTKEPLKPIKAKNLDLDFHLRIRKNWNLSNALILDSVTGDRVGWEQIGWTPGTGSPAPPPISPAPAPAPTVPAGPPSGGKDPESQLTKENYKQRMHNFLTSEEKARQEILSKYNVSARLKLRDKYEKVGIGTLYAKTGHLFAEMESFRDISEDSAVGRLILRSCNRVLLSSTSELLRSEKTGAQPLVYLVQITDKAKNSIYLDLGAHCVETLNVSEGQTVLEADIQFQLDRTSFTEQKQVLSHLSPLHLGLLFPDFNQPLTLPWDPTKQCLQYSEPGIKLNPKQKEAIIAVTSNTSGASGTSDSNSNFPPILIIGPFGTGKTFTLFQCIKYLLVKNADEPGNRIMICTHSNSAADLYIKEYLDPFVADHPWAKPLRIYYTGRSLNTVHPTVLQYCLVENHTNFRKPTVEEVLAHRVIVVTLSTSWELIELGLPDDTFSHIFLDEAAQAMESEAITPLLAAGPSTRIVLAGDHMQLSPETFSSDSLNFHSSLLERLHCLYPDSSPAKLMLCENYRSHSTIIQFASDSFYQAKLLCGKIQPVHDSYYPLSFFTARGEDKQDPQSTSYYNLAEVYEVCDRVSSLISSWPEKWGDWRAEGSIGVLTPYADQVLHIRQRLRSRGLSHVSVERVLNVQGKQFRAVLLSTVRTCKPWVKILPETILGSEVDLGFFSNPKLLNTALTRAQSLVAVVGDPVSLCSLGKCRRLWEDFIKICKDNNSLYGMNYTNIREAMLGLELKGAYGLNPLAPEFNPDPVALHYKLIEHKNKEQGQKSSQVGRGSSGPATVPSQKYHATAAMAYYLPPPTNSIPAPVSAWGNRPMYMGHPIPSPQGPIYNTYYPNRYAPTGPGPYGQPGLPQQHVNYYAPAPARYTSYTMSRPQSPAPAPGLPPPPAPGITQIPHFYQQAIPPPPPQQAPNPVQVHVGPMYHTQYQPRPYMAMPMGFTIPVIPPMSMAQQHQPSAPVQVQVPLRSGNSRGTSAFVEYCPTARNVPNQQYLQQQQQQQQHSQHQHQQLPHLQSTSAFPPLVPEGNAHAHGAGAPLPQYQNQNPQGQVQVARNPNAVPRNLNAEYQVSRIPFSERESVDRVLRNPPSNSDKIPRETNYYVPRNPSSAVAPAPAPAELNNFGNYTTNLKLNEELQILKQIWTPAPAASSVSGSGTSKTQIFSSEEISYLQRILSEHQQNSSDDPAIQSIKTKLAYAGVNVSSASAGIAETPAPADAAPKPAPLQVTEPTKPQPLPFSTLDPDYPYSKIWAQPTDTSSTSSFSIANSHVPVGPVRVGFFNNTNTTAGSGAGATHLPYYSLRNFNNTEPAHQPYYLTQPNHEQFESPERESKLTGTPSYANIVKTPVHQSQSSQQHQYHHEVPQPSTTTRAYAPAAPIPLFQIPLTRPTPVPTKNTNPATTTASGSGASGKKRGKKGKR